MPSPHDHPPTKAGTLGSAYNTPKQRPAQGAPVDETPPREVGSVGHDPPRSGCRHPWSVPCSPPHQRAYAACLDRPPQPLTRLQSRRLARIVRRRAPDLVPTAEAVNQRWLSDEECEALSRVTRAEFLDHLGPNDQPDQEGVDADDLLGVIEMQRRGFWQS